MHQEMIFPLPTVQEIFPHHVSILYLCHNKPYTQISGSGQFLHAIFTDGQNQEESLWCMLSPSMTLTLLSPPQTINEWNTPSNSMPIGRNSTQHPTILVCRYQFIGKNLLKELYIFDEEDKSLFQWIKKHSTTQIPNVFAYSIGQSNNGSPNV